jgi:hypothetical protein
MKVYGYSLKGSTIQNSPLAHTFEASFLHNLQTLIRCDTCNKREANYFCDLVRFAIVLETSDRSISAGSSCNGLGHKQIFFTIRNVTGKILSKKYIICFVEVEITEENLYFFVKCSLWLLFIYSSYPIKLKLTE